MSAIPELLAKPINSSHFILGVGVERIESGKVTLQDGRAVSCKAVILAVDEKAACVLTGKSPIPEARSVTTIYYGAPKLPWHEKLLALNATQKGLINHLAVLSQVQPSYSKGSRHLISVNIVNQAANQSADFESIRREVEKELIELLGEETKTWDYLRHYCVKRALPTRFAYSISHQEGLFYAGDYVENPSIQGAMLSGENAARRLLNTLGVSNLAR
jgi:predicted NAD/FAD-dependent oxidoreductase